MGAHSPHPAIYGRKPVVQIDFALMSTKEHPGMVVNIFTGIDVRTQLAMAVAAPSKSVNRYGVKELNGFIFETGRTKAICQCDDENSMSAIRRVALQAIGV